MKQRIRVLNFKHWAIPAMGLAVATALGGCGGGGGSDSSPVSSPPASFDSTLYSSTAGAALGQANELAATTHHQIVVGGATLAYTAAAGHLSAKSPTTGAPEASVFYVAYTLDNKPAATRPVTFFYNGGPGSASVWLHLGSFGPRRLVTGDPATTGPVPFPLVDNAESLLDVSDLVFVDAVGTGFSEAIAPNTNQTFWGVDADAAVFRDFVVRYLAANNRTASPLFLFGESYGTTRSAVLAFLLETAGTRVNGVVLQSSILNYNSNCSVSETSLSCAGYVPSYGAIGAYYNLDVPNPADATLPDYVAQMRTLTSTAYDPAVAQFLAGVAPSAALVTQMSNATGPSTQKWQTNFNMSPDFYQTNLLPGTLIGRYDARVSAPVGSVLASEGDPSSTFFMQSFVTGIGNYLSAELQYTTPSVYVVSSNVTIMDWKYAHDGIGLPDVVPDLAAAMAQDPALQVLSLNGYHDLATPFFQTERDLARLGGNPNVQTTFYRGGHMTYLDNGSRPLEKVDLVQFYQRATAQQ